MSLSETFGTSPSLTGAALKRTKKRDQTLCLTYIKTLICVWHGVEHLMLYHANRLNHRTVIEKAIDFETFSRQTLRRRRSSPLLAIKNQRPSEESPDACWRSRKCTPLWGGFRIGKFGNQKIWNLKIKANRIKRRVHWNSLVKFSL